MTCCFYVIPLKARRHADQEKTLAALNAEMAQEYRLPGDIANAVRHQYSEFERVSVVLTDLQTTSSRTGLVVLDATSRPIETKEKTLFGQVQISTRMKGNYKDVKNVISKLLAAHEGLSLDALTFRRARSADSLLDAEVRMTFYYKKDA
jgi:Tfp pilus assembly protein PilO